MDDVKDLWWEGSSLNDLREFPEAARQAVGYQLFLVQGSDMPEDWKPLNNLGRGISGVYEIRVSVGRDIYRTAYVAKFGDKVAVLHCWQKKTRTTSKSDLDIIVSRYRSAKETLG